MNLILRQVIGEIRGKRTASTTTDPLLKNQLAEKKKQLNSILKKWKWGESYPTSSTEFLNKFSPWVDTQIKNQQEWKVFLSKWGSTSLNQLETTWKDTEQGYQEQIRELQTKGASELSAELQEKLENYTALEAENQRLNHLLNDEETDREKQIQKLLAEIEKLKERATTELSEADQEKLANYDNLEIERDEAKRDKLTLEQEVLAINNRLNLKNQEVQNKEQQITHLKKEAAEKEKAQAKTIKEKNSLITTLQKEINQQKEKYSKQEKLLDEKQLECKKLTEKIEQLEQEVSRLTTALQEEINNNPNNTLE